MQYSNNLLQMRVEYYLMLIYNDSDEHGKKEFIKELNRQLQSKNINENTLNSNVDYSKIKNAIELIATSTSAISSIAGLFTVNPIAKVILSAIGGLTSA